MLWNISALKRNWTKLGPKNCQNFKKQFRALSIGSTFQLQRYLLDAQNSNLIELFFHHQLNKFFVSYVHYSMIIVQMIRVRYQQLVLTIGKVVVD